MILKAIAKNSNGLRISEIASMLNISKSTVHGIVAALEEQGAINRNPASKRYSIGMTLIELGRAASERIDFKNIARPVMKELMEQCQESVFLGIRNGDKVTVIDIVESRKDIKIKSPVGTALPLLAGATGKLFLSRMKPDDLKQYLFSNPLIRFTPKTIVEPDLYALELDKVRRDRVACDDEEYISGVRAVAASIKQCDTYLPAIWVVGFKTSMTRAMIPKIIEQIKAAALKINDSI